MRVIFMVVSFRRLIGLVISPTRIRRVSSFRRRPGYSWFILTYSLALDVLVQPAFQKGHVVAKTNTVRSSQ